MGGRSSKEKEEAKLTSEFFNMSKGLESKESLQIIAKKKAHLIIVSHSKDQTKTLCFQPDPREINRTQGAETCSFKSSPIREDDSQGIKNFDRELRTRFENTSSFPYSVHGIVRVDNGNGKYKTGTGILIGPDLVLTAAHNIYDSQGTKQKYSRILFIPGINEEVIPFGIFNAIKSYVPEEYTKTWEQEDYALLVLNGTPGAQAGYFGLHIAEKQLLKGKELHVIGYPATVRTKDGRNKLKVLPGKGRHQLWGMKGTAWFFDDKGENGEFLINYEDILTTPGQSGSGVFYQIEGTNEYYVIGVHVLGRQGENSYNSATWITKERFNQVEKWVSESRMSFFSQDGNAYIKELSLGSLKIGDFGLKLLSGYVLPHVEYLELTRSNISDEGLRTLSEKAKWPNLTTLSLSSNNIGEEGATALSNNQVWKNLKSLDLSYNKIGDKGATALSNNQVWKNLTKLDLSQNNIGAKGATALSNNQVWKNLTILDLSINYIGEKGAIALSNNQVWKNLTALYLTCNYIGEKGAIALSNNQVWKNLTALWLYGAGIGAEGATALSNNKVWKNITELDLSGNNIGAEGATALSNNQVWKNLTKLDLSQNNIGAKGATALSNNQVWKNLKNLYLSKKDVSISTKGVLRKRWPELELELK